MQATSTAHFDLDRFRWDGFTRSVPSIRPWEGDEGGEGGDGDGDGAGAEGGSQDDGGEGSESKFAKQLAAMEAKNKQLEKQLGAANAEAAERKAALKDLGGVTPEEVAQLRKEKEEREQADRERRGEYEKQLGVERKKAAEAESKVEETRKRYEQQLIRGAIDRAAAANHAVETAMAEIAGASQIVHVTESLFEFDAESNKVVHVSETDSDGKPLTPEAYFERERTGTLANMFASKVKNGAGTSDGSSGGSGVTVKISRSNPNWLSEYEKAKKDGAAFELTD